MRDDAFAAAAEVALGHVPNGPVEFAAGQQIVPRDFLRALAEAACDWPYTAPEVSYDEIMKECFWALVQQRPAPSNDGDERAAAEGLALGVLLAMMSADRGGHHAAADLCQTALAYMATLPAWRGVGIEPGAHQTSLIIDVTRPDHGGDQSGDRERTAE